MQECPQCGLTNPDSAIMCDCGYDFESESGITADKTVSRNNPALPSEVVIKNINMSFGSMIVFMVKWAIASIPAIIIITIIIAVASSLLMGILTGIK